MTPCEDEAETAESGSGHHRLIESDAGRDWPGESIAGSQRYRDLEQNVRFAGSGKSFMPAANSSRDLPRSVGSHPAMISINSQGLARIAYVASTPFMTGICVSIRIGQVR